MKTLNELLGFVVLSGPLFLIVIWLPVSIWIAVKLAKRIISNRTTRIAGGSGLAVILFILPFADEIFGRVYHGHLCATKAGVKVYHTVRLPAEYWDVEGRPKFLKSNGDLDKSFLSNRYSEPAVKISYSNVFGIDEYHQQVRDNNTQKIIGEVINFMHWGGMISRNLNINPSAVDCENLHGNEFWTKFYSSLFRRSHNSKQEEQ